LIDLTYKQIDSTYLSASGLAFRLSILPFSSALRFSSQSNRDYTWASTTPSLSLSSRHTPDVVVTDRDLAERCVDYLPYLIALAMEVAYLP
jgi:hypothetical protein